MPYINLDAYTYTRPVYATDTRLINYKSETCEKKNKPKFPNSEGAKHQ